MANGFSKTTCAPASVASSRERSFRRSASADIAMIGSDGWSCRTERMSSVPGISGIIRSVSNKSTRWILACSKASRPLPAVMTENPDRSRNRCRMPRRSMSSSTRSIMPLDCWAMGTFCLWGNIGRPIPGLEPFGETLGAIDATPLFRLELQGGTTRRAPCTKADQTGFFLFSCRSLISKACFRGVLKSPICIP